MFQFIRYTDFLENAIELKVKVFGMAHGKVLISAITSLGDISPQFKIDQSCKETWKSQLFFAVHAALKKDYYDKFIAIESYLDKFKSIDL